MSGFKTDLLTGLGAYLAAGGIGATWNPSGAYTVLQTGIVLNAIPQKPDRLITLSTYNVDDSPALSDSVIGVQVRCRWGGQDPRPVTDLDDSIYNLIHGLTNVTLSTNVKIVQCLQNNSILLGQDVDSRWESVANYYVTVHRPSANRT